MIKKKLLCVLLILCLMISPIMSVCVDAAESNDIQKVSLSLYSNLTSDKYISGLYRDNVFYITTENLCKLTGATIVSESEEEVRINLSKGMRRFCIDVGSGNMQEILETDEFNVTMPSLFFEDKIYISAIHFLRYIGATVQIQEDSDCQFMVIKRYDIFDAWADYVESDYGNFFWWDEVHIGNGDIESELTKAGVIALINRDSNVFRMMFDAEGIEQEALEDALLSIVKNEGQAYFADESPESELIGTYSDLIGTESDWFGLITEAYSDGSDELAKQIGGLAESAAVASGFASNVVEAFEGLKQFDNMSTAQKNLLEKTILTYSDDSETLCDGWNVVYDAAYNINGKIQSEYDAQYKAALDASEATAYDFLNGVTSAAGANPVSIAWSGVNLLTKLIPYTNEFIENESQLYNSYNCSIIQLIANEIFTESVLDWNYSNGMVSNLSNQIGKLESSKYALILQLKSTITARECLLNSGYLNEDDAAEMRKLNRETVNLLNRTESCKITGVNLFDAEYDDDISWIKNYTKIDSDILSDSNAILSPESAVNIYMSNKNVWMENPEYIPMQGYGYCFLDLDFDGVLELINSVNDGSGRYSYNKYYKINLETYTVEEITTLAEGDEGGYDYYSMSHEYPKLLKSKSDNTLFYYCADFLRVTTGDYVSSYGKMYMKNSKVQSDYLFYEHKCESGMQGNDEAINEYSYYEKGKYIDVTEKQYNQKVKIFFKENVDMNLVWKCISGSDFDKSSDSIRKQLLLDAYRSFSYDGFSFNDVATYDIGLESSEKQPQFDNGKAMQYSMVDYYGMTINDVAELWGVDYTIMNGLIGGGWGGIYYEDKRCPFVFCFESSTIPSKCTGEEVLSGIVVYPEIQNNNFFVIDNVKILCSYSEVSQKLDGESYTNELYGGQSYSHESKNGAVLVFTWTDNSELPSEISATFK